MKLYIIYTQDNNFLYLENELGQIVDIEITEQEKNNLVLNHGVTCTAVNHNAF